MTETAAAQHPVGTVVAAGRPAAVVAALRLAHPDEGRVHGAHPRLQP